MVKRFDLSFRVLVDFLADDVREPFVQQTNEPNHEHEWNLPESIRRP